MIGDCSYVGLLVGVGVGGGGGSFKGGPMNTMIEGRDRMRLQVDPKQSSQAALFPSPLRG